MNRFRVRSRVWRAKHSALEKIPRARYRSSVSIDLPGLVKKHVRSLLELRDTPHAIAGGVAIGIFFGFIPLYGLKTLLCLGTAWLGRCSKLAAIVVVSLYDVLAPVLPFLMRLQYDVGYWLLSHPHHLPAKLEGHHLKFEDMLNWTTFFDVGLPILVGSIVIAVPFTAIGYVGTYAIAARRDSGRQLSSAA